MITLRVPSQCRCSAVKVPLIVPLKSTCLCRSETCSAVSAVEIRYPAPYARKRVDAQKLALTALTALPPVVTCANTSAVNGTATALPPGGPR
jgi:hypothetical protein